jgi:hypothetical protein
VAVCTGCVPPDGIVTRSFVPGTTPPDQFEPRFASVVPVVFQAIAPKLQFALLPVRSVELAAVTLAVVAGLSDTDTKLTAFVPVLFRLQLEPPTLDLTVIRFPLVPVSVSSPPTPKVLPASKLKLEPAVVSLKLLKFVAPVIACVTAPVN